MANRGQTQGQNSGRKDPGTITPDDADEVLEAEQNSAEVQDPVRKRHKDPKPDPDPVTELEDEEAEEDEDDADGIGARPPG